MSWQLYHEDIMTVISDSKIGTALGSLFSSITGGDRIGLINSGLAGLNGATAIASVLSGAYGDYEKEGGLAQLYYSVDGYAAVGYALTSFFLLGGEDFQSAVAFGYFPLIFYLLYLLSTKMMRTYPDEVAHRRFCATVLISCFLVASLLSDKGNPTVFLRIVSTLGIFRSARRILSPEMQLAKYKYKWDPKTEIWTKRPDHTDFEHKGESGCSRIHVHAIQSLCICACLCTNSLITSVYIISR